MYGLDDGCLWKDGLCREVNCAWLMEFSAAYRGISSLKLRTLPFWYIAVQVGWGNVNKAAVGLLRFL